MIPESVKNDIASAEKVTETEYFQRLIDREKSHPDLPLLARPCGDCAVTCGFYGEITEALSRQSPEMQLEASKKWDCHNHPGRACRGNADELGISW